MRKTPWKETVHRRDRSSSDLLATIEEKKKTKKHKTNQTKPEADTGDSFLIVTSNLLHSPFEILSTVEEPDTNQPKLLT